MKIPLIVFGSLMVLIGVLLFGSIGLSRLVRWLGQSQEVLVGVGFVLLLLSAICMAGWMFGNNEDREAARVEEQQGDNR